MDTWTPESPETCRILKSRIPQKSRLFAKSRDFCEILDFLDSAGFSGFGRISGFRDLGAQNRHSGLQGPESCPDRIPDLRSRSAGLSSTCQIGPQVRKSVSGPEILVPGCTYRPLSIATSVENDWARGGPFWRSPLTLALETVRF